MSILGAPAAVGGLWGTGLGDLVANGITATELNIANRRPVTVTETTETSVNIACSDGSLKITAYKPLPTRREVAEQLIAQLQLEIAKAELGA